VSYDLPLVLTIAELAAVLRVGRRTIERGLADGCFPIRPILDGVSARRVFARADVLRYLEDPAERIATRAARRVRHAPAGLMGGTLSARGRAPRSDPFDADF